MKGNYEMYDYLVVGSGLYGAIFAHEAKVKGKSVLVIDKRPNIGGNIYTEYQQYENTQSKNLISSLAVGWVNTNTTTWNKLLR